MPESVGAWSMIGSLAPLIWLAAGCGCALLILLLMPIFRNVAMAVPTQRSSHSTPTPQWGGVAISAATLGVTGAALHCGGLSVAPGGNVYALLVGAFVLAVLGGIDDMRSLSAAVKFIVQAAAVVLMLMALPDGLRTLPFVPLWVERTLLVLGALWFVNLVNFMDGIDWMMVAEVVPVTAGVAAIGLILPLPLEAVVLAIALNGAMLGFAPFNRPVARLFMGDTGSLPIGLLLAWLLILVAGSGAFAAALLLPLYFLADTGVTLLRRARAGERLWVAHRTHFYQRARDNGLSNLQIVGRVFGMNAVLAGLSVLSTLTSNQALQALLVVLGAALVAGVMVSFVRGRSA